MLVNGKIEGIYVPFKKIGPGNYYDIVPAGYGTTGWIKDPDFGRARRATLYYRATQIHHLSTYFGHSIVDGEEINHAGITTNYPFHSGSMANLPATGQRFAFDINDDDIQFVFTNASASDMDILDVWLRLQF